VLRSPWLLQRDCAMVSNVVAALMSKGIRTLSETGLLRVWWEFIRATTG
jgi:hypothetical protein